MADRNETLADIADEMRGEVLGDDGVFFTMDGRRVMEFADRIEAAWKEERRILVADAENAKDARNRTGIKLRLEFAEKCKACAAKVSNAAKLREALEKLIEFTCRCCQERYCEEPEEFEDGRGYSLPCNAILEAKHALAAPPRNCNRFASHSQFIDYWSTHARRLEKSGNWEIDGKIYPDAVTWLFAKAAQEGGEE